MQKLAVHNNNARQLHTDRAVLIIRVYYCILEKIFANCFGGGRFVFNARLFSRQCSRGGRTLMRGRHNAS